MGKPTTALPINLLPGDVCFVIHKNSFVSRMFAWFLQSKWSHAFLVVEQTQSKTYILETNDFGVVFSIADWYWAKADVEMEVWRKKGISDLARERVAKDAISSAWGESYGYLQLIMTGVRRLLKRVGITIPHFLRWGIMCNHVVLYGYANSPGNPFYGLDPESIDTGEMYEAIRGSSEFELVLSK